MTHVVVVAHQPLASALESVARHVYPGCAEQLICVDIEATWGLDKATDRVRDAVRSACAQSADDLDCVVLVDVHGATPGRAARAALPRAPMAVGVNVPMLWRTLCYSTEPAPQLLERALVGGTRGVGRWTDDN